MDCIAFAWVGEVRGMTAEPLLALTRPPSLEPAERLAVSTVVCAGAGSQSGSGDTEKTNADEGKPRTEVVNHARCEEVINRRAVPAKCGHFGLTTPSLQANFGREVDAHAPQSAPNPGFRNPRIAGKALCRTRTDDAFLTMEGSGCYERSRTLSNGHEIPANSCNMECTAVTADLRSAWI